jgi:CheY-like chemotaxis protein
MTHGCPDRPLVLIVEDEAMVRMLIADVLQYEGYKIIEAKNATEAVQVLQAQPDIQVLVTDAEMPPGPSGFELAHRTRERWPYIGIIITSGRRWPGRGDLPEGAVFLPKPWTAEQLARLVQEATDRGDRGTNN